MHRKWMEDPQYRKKYEALGEQFALAAAVIEARSRVGLTQQQLAKKMGTTQPAIARLESGRTPPRPCVPWSALLRLPGRV